LPLVAGGLDKKPAFKPFTPMGELSKYMTWQLGM
jgi:hypothetical protein